jgi:predicted site-specific integrase-resolvase
MTRSACFKTLKEFLTKYAPATEAAQALGLSRQRISALCKSGKLPGSLKLNGRLWIPRDAIAERQKKFSIGSP